MRAKARPRRVRSTNTRASATQLAWLDLLSQKLFSKPKVGDSGRLGNSYRACVGVTGVSDLGEDRRQVSWSPKLWCEAAIILQAASVSVSPPAAAVTRPKRAVSTTEPKGRELGPSTSGHIEGRLVISPVMSGNEMLSRKQRRVSFVVRSLDWTVTLLHLIYIDR